MGIGSNTSTIVPGISTAGPGVEDQCNTTYLCDQSYFLGADLLQFAPCPPPWKKSLLWEVARKKGLTDYESGQIALRCVIPHPENQIPGNQCGSSCIAIVVLSGCILLTICLATLCWSRRRGMVTKRRRSTDQNNTDHTHQATVGKTEPVYEEIQEGRVHYSNIMESAFDNHAYTNDHVTDHVTDHARSNSDTSNNSHTQLNGTATEHKSVDVRL
ncbi:uncharacterized protein LOC117323847 [Pecten maximus]|uniref:uncharacterized protein LOC117323847 n=1 Tax=Pecten maximus TaxID=6579 RepID=UPI00145876FD|nr:uncharacterized protein LOC117323847 [Pecten maximus]